MRALFKLTNIRGALVTMPHKIATIALMDAVSATARIAGACNAILRRPDGTLVGDMFDGEGFVRGVLRKGRRVAGARALVVGAGGVGSAIAASLAAAGSPGSICSISIPPPRRRSAIDCAPTIARSKSASALRTRTAATSSSTRRRSA